jgi:hypothetical protein
MRDRFDFQCIWSISQQVSSFHHSKEFWLGFESLFRRFLLLLMLISHLVQSDEFSVVPDRSALTSTHVTVDNRPEHASLKPFVCIVLNLNLSLNFHIIIVILNSHSSVNRIGIFYHWKSHVKQFTVLTLLLPLKRQWNQTRWKWGWLMLIIYTVFFSAANITFETN